MLIRVIAFLLSFLLIANPQVALSLESPAAADSSVLEIPAEYGRIERVSGGIRDASPQRPFVVYLQDAHGNFEGQKNIINLVHAVQNNFLTLSGPTPFFLEGLVGELDPDILKISKNPSDNEKALLQMIGKGKISAASYLSTLEPEKYRFIALEDGPLYKADLIAFQKATTQNAEALEQLKYYRNEVDSLIPRIFSRDSLEIYRKIEDRKRRSDLLPDHIKHLKSSLFDIFVQKGNQTEAVTAEQFGNTFPALDTLLLLEETGAQIDKNALEKEILEMFPQSKQGLTADVRKKLVEDYAKDPDKYQGHANLKKIAESELKREQIQSEVFFKELKNLEELIIRFYSGSPLEIWILDIAETLEEIQEILRLEISRDTWVKIKNNLEDYRSDNWLPEISTIRELGGLEPSPLPADNTLIDEGVNRSLLFYSGAEKRDEVFIEKISKFLETNNDSIVFLLTGGFHKHPLTEYFEKSHVPYAVISPRLTDLEQGHHLYLKEMKALQLSAAILPHANDTQPVTDPAVVPAEIVGYSLGGEDDVQPEAEDKPEEIRRRQGRYIQEFDMYVEDFDFGRQLLRMKILALRMNRIRESRGAERIFTPSQIGNLDSALKKGVETRQILHEEGDLGAALVAWGHTLLHLHEFLDNGQVQATLDNLKNLREGTLFDMEEGPQFFEVVNKFFNVYSNVLEEEKNINDIIAENLTFTLSGVHAKLKGKGSGKGGAGKSVAIGQLIIIDDVNTTEGTQALMDVHPDQILVVNNIPEKIINLQAAAIIGSHIVNEGSHPYVLADRWKVPLVELPHANVFLKRLNKQFIKITVDENNEVSFGPATEAEISRDYKNITRDRVILAQRGAFAIDQHGDLYQADPEKIVKDEEGVPVEANPANYVIFQKRAEGVSFHADDDENLWFTADWKKRKEDPNAKPIASKDQYFDGLLDEVARYVVDQEGRVYGRTEETKTVRHPKTGDPILKNQWYEGLFHQNAILRNEPPPINLIYPTPWMSDDILIPIDEIAINLAPVVGVKLATAGEMLLEELPGTDYSSDSFGATFAAYDRFIKIKKDGKTLEELLDAKDKELQKNIDKEAEVERISKENRESIISREMPRPMALEIIREYRKRFGNNPGIVRSTTNLEDLPQESAAGVYDSVLVRPNYLLTEYFQVSLEDETFNAFVESLLSDKDDSAQKFYWETFKDKKALNILSMEDHEIYQAIVQALKQKAIQEAYQDSNFLNALLEEPFLTSLETDKPEEHRKIKEWISLEERESLEELEKKDSDLYRLITEAIDAGLWNRGILLATKKVWASVWSERAVKLRDLYKINHKNVRPGAWFLEFIEGEVGGVAFSTHKGDFNKFLVNVAHGGSMEVVDSANEGPAQFTVDIISGELEDVQTTYAPPGVSTISSTTVFEDGRPVSRYIDDVAPDKKNEPVLTNEIQKRIVVETVLDARHILKSIGIDAEFIFDKNGRFNLTQARYQVYDVYMWEDAFFGILLGKDISLFEKNGEEFLRQINRYRRNKDIEGLLNIASDPQYQDIMSKGPLYFAMASVVRKVKGTTEEDSVLNQLIPHFKEEGLFYKDIGKLTNAFNPLYMESMDQIIVSLRDRGVLPEEFWDRLMEVFLEETHAASHMARPQIVRIINELMDRILFDETGSPKTDLTDDEKEKLKKLKQNLDLQLYLLSAKALVVSQLPPAKKGEVEDDPKRLPWIFNQIIPYLNSPRKDEIISELFLATGNEFVLNHAIRNIDDPAVLKEESKKLMIQKRAEEKKIAELQVKIDEIVQALMPIGEEEYLDPLYRFYLVNYLEKLAVMHHEYGDRDELEQMVRQGALRNPDYVHKYLAGKSAADEEEINVLQESLSPNEEQMKAIYRTFGQSKMMGMVLKLDSEWEEAEMKLRNYRKAHLTIAAYLTDRPKAVSRARELFQKAHEAQNNLQVYIAKILELRAVIERLGLQDNPEIKRAIDLFDLQQRVVIMFYSEASDTTKTQAFRHTTNKPLRDPTELFQSHSSLTHYLNYLQDSSYKVQRLMNASRELKDVIRTRIAPQKDELPEGLQHYLERLPNTYDQFHKLLNESISDLKQSPFTARRSEIKQEPHLNIGSELIEAVYAYRHSPFIKNKENIRYKIAEDIPEELAINPLPFTLALYNVLENALEATSRKEDEMERAGESYEPKVTVEAELFDDSSGQEGVLVTVHDNGPGIPAQDIDRIFDLDYSTKRGGEYYTPHHLTKEMKSPFGSGLSVVKRRIEKDLNGWIEASPDVEEGAEIRIFIPIKGKSLGNSMKNGIRDLLLDRYQIEDEAFREQFASDCVQSIQESGQALTREAAEEPQLVVVEGVASLPETFTGFKRLLTENRYLVVFDRNLATDELKEVLLEKYQQFVLPERLGVKGFEGVKRISQKDLSALTAGMDAEFEGRIAFVIKEESGDLRRQASRLTFPHRIMYTETSPNDLVLPLSFHIITTDGKVGAQFDDYIEQRSDQVFRIRALDELVRLILLQSEAERVMATAA